MKNENEDQPTEWVRMFRGLCREHQMAVEEIHHLRHQRRMAKSIIVVLTLLFLFWLLFQPVYFGQNFWEVGPVQWDRQIGIITIRLH